MISEETSDTIGNVDYGRWTTVALSLELIILKVYIDGVNIGTRNNMT